MPNDTIGPACAQDEGPVQEEVERSVNSIGSADVYLTATLHRLTQLAKVIQSRKVKVIALEAFKADAEIETMNPMIHVVVRKNLTMRIVLEYTCCDSSVAVPSSSS